MHLVGFTIEIYHDARFYKRRKKSSKYFKIASALYRSLSNEGVKKGLFHFKCLRWQRYNFVAVSTLPASYGLGGIGVDIFVTSSGHFEPSQMFIVNPLNAELNPICCLLALLGAHHFLHVSRIRAKSLILRLLMSYIYISLYIYIYIYIYIYMEHPFLMFLDHTPRRTTVGRTPLDE